jgi:flagellar hook-length control protein FliK
MGLITIPKKIKSEPLPDTLLSEFAAEIDNVGKLLEEAEPIQAEIRKLQAKLKPLAEAQKSLQARLDALPLGDDQEGQFEYGIEFLAEVGKKGTSRSVKDLKLVKKHLGDDLFMKLASVTLKSLDQYLTPPQLSEVLTSERTSRSVKITRRT